MIFTVFALSEARQKMKAKTTLGPEKLLRFSSPDAVFWETIPRKGGVALGFLNLKNRP